MRRVALRSRYLSIPAPLRRIGSLLMALWVLNFVAVVVWSARNDACVRGHTVYVPQSRDENAHQDWVCDVYKPTRTGTPGGRTTSSAPSSTGPLASPGPRDAPRSPTVGVCERQRVF